MPKSSSSIFPFLSPNFDPSSELLKMLPSPIARRYQAVPIAMNGKTLTLALSRPCDRETLAALRFALDKEIDHVVIPYEKIKELLSKFYGQEEKRAPLFEEKITQNHDDYTELLPLDFSQFSLDKTYHADEVPIIHYVNLLLDHAIQAEVSDLHLEPFENECKVRYRIDGLLYEMKPLPAVLALPIISRIKVMSHLNIAERRLPQDGRMQRLFQKTAIDFRVSTLPTQFGESVVLRLLDRRRKNRGLHALEMPTEIEKTIVNIIKKPHGLFIVTGPTGSGKTTTLYACLQEIHANGLKLLTAEDPVEYEIDGIMQVPINEVIGLNFSSILRSFLRHDPDVIMIGETRDEETARMAMQASLTGHLVLTTLHTNNAATAITRLMDMGIDAFMLSSTVEAILAQRLVRKICTHCRIFDELEETTLAALGFLPHDQKKFYRGQGCPHCHHTGYQGRVALFELLVINKLLRNLIHQRTSHNILQEKARECGMKTLREQALLALLSGITTAEEVLKWT